MTRWGKPTKNVRRRNPKYFINESYTMGSDPRHPNPGSPDISALNWLDHGEQQYLEKIMTTQFPSTKYGSGGGVDKDNMTSYEEMYGDAIPDREHMRHQLEQDLVDDGMPDEEIQNILAHLDAAMDDLGLV